MIALKGFSPSVPAPEACLHPPNFPQGDPLGNHGLGKYWLLFESFLL